MTERPKRRIPLWVNIMQAVLVLIMVVQAYELFFNHDALVAAGWETEGDPALNLIYEMGARLVAMIVASIFVMITQNPKQYLVVLIMNVVRESLEGVIDPLFPVADASAPPLADFLIHVLIVAIEIAALVTVARIARREAKTLAVSAA
ncbi:MAG: hypothetical protein ACR2QO_05165 [Acidimicrobiales bacterium]